MKIENFCIQTLLEDAVDMEGVDERFVGSAYGEVDAAGFAVAGFSGEGD